MQPRVSIVIPTRQGRAPRLERVLAQAHGQTYRNVEVLCDDGPGTLGEVRNRLVAQASGDVIVHFDDDDDHAPDRVERQVCALVMHPLVLVCGTSQLYGWDDRGRYGVEQSFADILGASMAYRRAAWEACRFTEAACAECNAFKAHHLARTIDLRDRGLLVYRRHDGNASGSLPAWGQNRAAATEAVRSLGWAIVD